MKRSKYLQFGVSIKLVPRIAEYQKRRFEYEPMFLKLPLGSQMNLTLSALLDDADLLQELLKIKENKEEEK